MIKKEPLNWQVRDTLVLLIIPFEFFLSYLFGLTLFKTHLVAQTLFALVSKSISLVFILYLYRDLLQSHWQLFKKNPWLKLLIAIAGSLVLTLLLMLVRVSTSRLVLSADTFEDQLSLTSLLLMAFATIPPLMAPFIEEIIFRHVLVFKFVAHKFVCFIMLVLSSVIFGAIHYFNFGGYLLLTFPYMIAALYFGVIYLWTKNIWYSLTIHFIFNFTNSLLPVIALTIFSLFVK